MSSGEIRAWAALRTLRSQGIHVVRQHDIGRYTVDFAIRKARIAIEIDGAVHDFPGRPEYDAERQAHLESKGWRFVRIRSEQTHDSKIIIDAVLAALPLPLRGGGRGWGEAPISEGSRESEASPNSASDGASPHPPTPSPQGEGEFALHLRRRTRANRKLPPRRKNSSPSPSRGGGRGWGEAPTSGVSRASEASPNKSSNGASPHPPAPSPQEAGES